MWDVGKKRTRKEMTKDPCSVDHRLVFGHWSSAIPLIPYAFFLIPYTFLSLHPTSFLLHPFIGLLPQSIHRIKPCQLGPPVHVFIAEKSPILLGYDANLIPTVRGKPAMASPVGRLKEPQHNRYALSPLNHSPAHGF